MDTKLTVSLAEAGADGARLDTLHRQVRDELGQVDDLEVVTRVEDGGSSPAGTRALGPAEISALSVAILGSGGAAGLIAGLRAWLARGHDAPRMVRLEINGDAIVLEAADTTERAQLLRMFLDRHGMQEAT
jgi:hypothetical protein